MICFFHIHVLAALMLLTSLLIPTTGWTGVNQNVQPDTWTLDDEWNSHNSKWVPVANSRQDGEIYYTQVKRMSIVDEVVRSCSHSVSSDGRIWYMFNEGRRADVNINHPQISIIVKDDVYEAGDDELMSGWKLICTSRNRKPPPKLHVDLLDFDA